MSNQTIHELTNLSEISTNDELPIWDNSAGATKKVSVEELSLAVNNTVNSYSTEEVNTGKKWIDGKPIYKKVIDLGNLPNATVKRVNTNITDLAKVVSLQGMANIANTDYFFPLPLPSKTNVNEVVNMYHYNSQIVIESGVDRSTWIGVATIEYTKTTD